MRAWVVFKSPESVREECESMLGQGHRRGVWKQRGLQRWVWQWPQADEMPLLSASLRGVQISQPAWSAGLKWQPSNLICQKHRLLVALLALGASCSVQSLEVSFSPREGGQQVLTVELCTPVFISGSRMQPWIRGAFVTVTQVFLHSISLSSQHSSLTLRKGLKGQKRQSKRFGLHNTSMNYFLFLDKEKLCPQEGFTTPHDILPWTIHRRRSNFCVRFLHFFFLVWF